MNWWAALFSEDNSRVSTQFALAVFCTFAGFVAAVSLYLVYGIAFFWTHADMPEHIAGVTKIFVLQTVGGAAAAVLYRPRGVPPPGGQSGLPPGSGGT